MTNAAEARVRRDERRLPGAPPVPYFSTVPAPQGPPSASWFALPGDGERARPEGSTSSPPPLDFGTALRLALEERGIPYRVLAARIGAGAGTVTTWVGDVRPKPDTIRKVLRVLPELREAAEAHDVAPCRRPEVGSPRRHGCRGRLRWGNRPRGLSSRGGSSD